MKKFCVFLLSMVLLLAGCQGKTPAPTEAYSIQATLTLAPTRTSSPPTSVVTAAPPGCTVVSPRPTPGATETSIFPPPGKDDWIKGPDDASVTLIEYSDFM